MEETKDTKTERKSKKKSKSYKISRIIKAVILAFVIILLCIGIMYAGSNLRRFTTVRSEKKLALVDRQLSFCQELVTAKYRYSDIITLKKTSGFAKSYSIIKYTGLVRAGINDITDVSYSVSLDGKTITLNVPPAEILGNEIVSQSVFDEKQSVFVPITTQEIFDEIEAAKVAAVEDMITDGLLEDARDYAIRIIRQFMLALGFEDVIIKS